MKTLKATTEHVELREQIISALKADICTKISLEQLSGNVLFSLDLRTMDNGAVFIIAYNDLRAIVFKVYWKTVDNQRQFLFEQGRNLVETEIDFQLDEIVLKGSDENNN